MASQSKTIVLISGGNGGIGYEIVKKLAQENPSFHVLMGCRDTNKGEEAAASLGALSNVNPIQLDISHDDSIEHCFKTIEQKFGRLDILINNAGTAGRDLPDGGRKGKSVRQVYTHIYNVNVISTACLTEAMIPLLSKSKLPKIIFITSALGSIADVLRPESNLIPVPHYNSSKSAMNMLCAYYAKKYPDWKVNACCPGLNSTGLSDTELTEKTHPRNGAINAARLATEGPDGATGTFTNKEGPLPW